MSAESRTLFWKEWRERKSQLAVCTAWMLCAAIYVVGYEMAHRFRAPVAGFYSVAGTYSLIAAVFLAMRTAVGETTQKTIGFTAALPVSLRRIAWARLGGAAVTLAGPIVLAAVVVTVALGTGLVEQASPRSHELAPLRLPDRASLTGIAAVGFLWKATALEIASAITLLVIIVLAAARFRAESHVGFLGAVLGIGSLVLPDFRKMASGMSNPALFDWCGAILPQALAVNYGFGAEHGSYGDLDLAPHVWGPLALNLLVLFALGAAFARRYGSLPAVAGGGRARWRLWQFPAILSRLPLRWPGRVPALIWLDLRQAVPLALAGLGVACLVTMFTVLVEFHNHGPFAARIGGELPGATWFIAELWAVIVAAGIFAAELQPGLGTFWRSRPIAPALWYSVKFVVGLVAVLGVLDGVTIAVSWNSQYGAGPNQMSWSYVACLPIMHATMYAVTVLGVCWLRRPMFGALAGLLTYGLVSIVIEAIPGAGAFDPLTVYNGLFHAERQGVFDLRDHNYPFVFGTLSGLILLAALLAVPAVLKPEPVFNLFGRRSRASKPRVR